MIGCLSLFQENALVTPGRAFANSKRGDRNMPSYESSMQNLEKAQERWHPPRRWRSTEESQIIQRFVAFRLGRPQIDERVSEARCD